MAAVKVMLWTSAVFAADVENTAILCLYQFHLSRHRFRRNEVVGTALTFVYML